MLLLPSVLISQRPSTGWDTGLRGPRALRENQHSGVAGGPGGLRGGAGGQRTEVVWHRATPSQEATEGGRQGPFRPVSVTQAGTVFPFQSPSSPLGLRDPCQMLSLLLSLAGPPRGAWATSTFLRGSEAFWVGPLPDWLQAPPVPATRLARPWAFQGHLAWRVSSPSSCRPWALA